MLDFSQIRYQGTPLTPKTYHQLHLDSLAFIEKALKKESSKLDRKLVITHHVPCFSNYPKKHQNDPIMAGFASNLNDFIKKTAPNGWIYGHHHFNIPPFLLGKTQLFTNQLGYKNHKKTSNFNLQAILDID
jgi:Icc-related predicted phosphoesterase